MARCSQLMCVWDFTWCECVEMWFINRARKLSQNARMLGAGLWRLRQAQRNRWMTCIVQLGAATHSVTSMHIIQSVRCPLDFNRLLGARLLGCIGMCRPSWSRIFFRYWSLRQPVKSATTFFVCRPFIENACVRMSDRCAHKHWHQLHKNAPFERLVFGVVCVWQKTVTWGHERQPNAPQTGSAKSINWHKYSTALQCRWIRRPNFICQAVTHT